LFLCGHSRDVLNHLHEAGLLQHMLPEVDAAYLQSDADRQWLERVTRQFDTWRANRAGVSAELMFALLFGLIHERQIERRLASGTPRFHAAEDAVREHLVSLAARVTIPKAVGIHLAQLMAVQPFFLNMSSHKARKFMHRKCFHDAFIYFKIRSRFENRYDEAIHFWTQLIRGRE